MELSGVGKTPNSSLSFRYNANNEELEELYNVCEDDPPTPQCDPPPATSQSENASPKRGERSASIIDKYFKSIRTEKLAEKLDDAKPVETKILEEPKPPKEEKKEEKVSSSPMKEYLNRLGKRSTSEVSPDVKESTNETWKIFHDFKFKIAQAVEDMKTRSLEESKEKSVVRENSTSDSEENSATKDLDQQSVGDTDNQVSSLDSSIQNLSEMTQPLTAKALERESSLPVDCKNYSDSSDDTHKNLVFNESEVTKDYDNSLEVESGIEALEDTIDGFGDIHDIDNQSTTKPLDTESIQPVTTTSFGLPPSKNIPKEEPKDKTKSRTYFFTYTMYFLTFLLIINFVLFPNSSIWKGFMLGLWFFCLASHFQSWFLDNYFTDGPAEKSSRLQLKRSSAVPMHYTIPSVKEHRPMKKYESWINHYRFPEYDPFTYHINKTTTAFMKLEGCNLRISYTTTKISKRALWDEKIDKVAFYQHRLYNLSGARVILLPKGLVKRRQWSKKYPICVVLSDKEKVQVLEKENNSVEKRVTDSPSDRKKESIPHEVDTETNTSPEKKKKFVWRRKEKSSSVLHTEAEPGKEGLRHRIVRKMHRDKKTDNVSTTTEPVDTQGLSPLEKSGEETFHDADELISKSVTSTKDDEEDFDETELSKIKDFLEETEMETGAEGTVEGEWSVHVKHTSSHLYLFARTGREKHEWYRRFVAAITEANASAESSAADDKTGSDISENKDGIEMALYKPAEKTEAVTFSKTSAKPSDKENAGLSISESGGVVLTPLSQTLMHEESYENFWPYLIKIIQQNKGTTSPTCQCRMLPTEVTWLNTVVARIAYDAMRDPIMVKKVQNRIQRKLNTIKLPSFMSPLVVTELSLAGACPLVERVQPPAWDERGVWLDFDLRYEGGAFIALLTQINLMKLKEKNMTLEEQLMTSEESIDDNVSRLHNAFSEKTLRKRKPAVYDSDMEDSAESSSDDETPPIQPVDSNETVTVSESGSVSPAPEGGSSKKKFLRMVDKIATNKYFQQVTDYKYIKRAMEGLSNTDIKLHLEVHALEGRLALNLPPPPHDRAWIGFRQNPQLILKARPAVGARTLRFAHISNWIEQKLLKEFEKVLVLPNMEDIIVDCMTPTPVDYE